MTQAMHASAMRQIVASAAMQWVGTPYHHHARVRGVGVDCVQLLCAVYESCNLTAPIDPGQYAVDWHMHRNRELYLEGLQRYGVETGSPQAGDVALFRFGRTYSHGGVMISRDQVVHAYMGSGVIVTRLTEEPLADRQARFFTLPAFANGTP